MAGRTNDPRHGNTHSTDDDRHTPDERPRVAPLSDLSDFKVAENEPDIRGWKVRSSDSREVGKVKDLIADTGSMKIRYLDIELDKKSLDLRDDRRVLVPIGAARLNDDDDLVLINRASSEFTTLPEYSGEGIDRGYEDRVRQSWGSSTSGRTAAAGATSSQHHDDQFNDSNFFGRRRKGRENESYFTRSEEELRVGKRQQEAGEVDVKKRVETERVSKSVPVTRDEVTVERRPASGQTASGKIGENEVRIPLMAEEAVVEKRTVPQEEVVVRKHSVQDEQTVEADLKKERLDVSEKGNVERENRDTR
jgi:uncharacterized protein (TIGR02271 family)